MTMKMQSLGDNLGIFFIHRKIMFCSWGVQLFILNHSINFEICDVTMNFRPYVWIYILNPKLFCHETWSTNRYIQSWTIVLGNICEGW